MLDTREPANAASGLPEAGESGRDAGTRAARTKAGGNGNVKGAGRPKGLKIPYINKKLVVSSPNWASVMVMQSFIGSRMEVIINLSR